MKIPQTPPDHRSLFLGLLMKDMREKTNHVSQFSPTDKKGRYLHWDELKHKNPPRGFSVEEWWAGMKNQRSSLYKQTVFKDKIDQPFQLAMPDCVLKDLHWLDQKAAGTISGDRSLLSSEPRKNYLINSLIKEAITSSQLEGASTTFTIAKEMLRQKRAPRDTSEQMIINNYRAMVKLRDFKSESLTIPMVLELHKILTEKTLADENNCGKFRTTDDVRVHDPRDQEVLHIPPEAKQLNDRMKVLCEFANEEESEIFLHPVVKAILLHFMLAYNHPFEDGNGRTARALFYWFMARKNYWMIENISISEVLQNEQGKYTKAYLHTETDENDLTYFIIHQLSVIRKAIDALHIYLDKKVAAISSAREMLERSISLKGKLNNRQISFLKHAMENPRTIYTIQEYQGSHRIAYETARKDLMQMSDELKLLIKQKRGKAFVFVSPEDLKARLELEA
jgi:Fic family protein